MLLVLIDYLVIDHALIKNKRKVDTFLEIHLKALEISQGS